MSSLLAEAHTIYQIGNAALRPVPFPHLIVEDVFPAEYFSEIRSNLPDRTDYRRMDEAGRAKSGEYDERLVFPVNPDSASRLPEPKSRFWNELHGWLAGKNQVRDLVLMRFAPFLAQRFGGRDPFSMRYSPEILLTRDLSGYQIPPHTDNYSRAFSILFYIPPDASLAAHGTSVYVPKRPGDYKDHHHQFGDFVRMATAPYKPNLAFVFPRLDNSFHGVEPVDMPGIERDILMLLIRVQG